MKTQTMIRILDVLESKRVQTIAKLVAFVLTWVLVMAYLSGCSSSSNDTTPVNLNGHWTQTENGIDGTTLDATVTDGYIEVSLEIGGITGPYWAGTFVDGAVPDPTSFESHIDPDAISYSKMAKTKKFLYSGGALSFQFGAMGKTTVVYMSKDA